MSNRLQLVPMTNRSTLVIGLRQTGKTTFLLDQAKENKDRKILFVTKNVTDSKYIIRELQNPNVLALSYSDSLPNRISRLKFDLILADDVNYYKKPLCDLITMFTMLLANDDSKMYLTLDHEIDAMYKGGSYVLSAFSF